eukprot:m.431158 g.431158  ORF g.431158 m.431158 type:complete len:491 (+) comp17266_c0_seq1:557-2029(+)
MCRGDTSQFGVTFTPFVTASAVGENGKVGERGPGQFGLGEAGAAAQTPSAGHSHPSTPHPQSMQTSIWGAPSEALMTPSSFTPAAVAENDQNAALGVFGDSKKTRCPLCSRPAPMDSECGWCAKNSHMPPASLRSPPGLVVARPARPAQPLAAAAPGGESRFASLWGPPSPWFDPVSAAQPVTSPTVTDWRVPGQGRPPSHTTQATPPPSPPSAGRTTLTVTPPHPSEHLERAHSGERSWTLPSSVEQEQPQAGVTGPGLSGLDSRVIDGLSELGIATLLPAQPAVITAVGSGRDVLVAGKAGSGRTTAVGIALLDQVDLARGPQVLVISPTKDTAVETQRSLAAAGRFKRVKVHASFGGKSGDRAHIKSRKPQIVSATLGRALDNMKVGGPIDAADLRTLVVDDCDQMHRKFPSEMSQLFALLPPSCQIVLVSAGVGKLTRDWANNILRDPLKLDESSNTPAPSSFPHPIFASVGDPTLHRLPVPGHVF